MFGQNYGNLIFYKLIFCWFLIIFEISIVSKMLKHKTAKIFIYLTFALLFLITAYFLLFPSNKPSKYISELNNITSIHIISKSGDTLAEFDNEDNIKYFLSTFKPSQTNPPKEIENFEIDNYILFMEEEKVKFKIAVDYSYGYSCQIKNVEYIAQFTYATHRYLMDIW